MALVIYNWDDVEALADVFSAISDVATNPDVQTAMQVVLVIGASIYIIRAFLRGKDLFQSFLLFFVGTLTLIFLFTKWKVDVVIENPYTGDISSVVSDVPGIIAYATYISAKTEKVLLDVVSSHFQTPNGINYANTGYNYGGVLFSSLPKLRIKDPYLVRSVKEYISGCFYEDIIRGAKDFDSMYTTNDLWYYLQPSLVGSLPVYYYTSSNPNGVLTDCSGAYSYLSSQLDTVSSSQLNPLIETLTGVKNTPTDWVKAAFADFLSTTVSGYTDVYKNTVAARYMYDSLQYAAVNSTVSSNISEYAKQIAKNNIFAGWELGGNMARELIPVVKQFILLLLVAVYPFLLFLILTPMAVAYIRMFIVLFLWLSLWSPMFAIITYIAHVRLTELFNGVSSGSGYSMATMPIIFEQAISHVAIWNYLSLLVPMLSFVLAKASEYAVVSFASGFMKAFEGAGGALGRVLSTPQSAGKLAGESREISIYGTDLSYNRTAGQTYYGALSSYGSVHASATMETFSPGSIRKASFARTIEDTEQGRYVYDNSIVTPFDIGQANAIRKIINTAATQEGIKYKGGDVSSYIKDLATKQGIDSAVVDTYLKAIDNVFGNKDGSVSLDELSKFREYLTNVSSADFSSKQAEMEKLADIFMKENPGLSFQQALLMGASAVGMGQAYFKVLKGFRNKGQYDAIKNVFGGLDSFANFVNRISTMEFSSEKSKLESIMNALGKRFSGNGIELLKHIGNYFGISKGIQEAYLTDKFMSFIKSADGKTFSEKVQNALSLASMEGFLDVHQAQGVKKALEALGEDTVTQMIESGTFGNFLMKMAQGLENKETLKALGGGNYEKGIQEFARISSERERMNLWETASMIDKMADYYQRTKGLSREVAIKKASEDLGFVLGSQKIGVADLVRFGDKLENAYKTQNTAEIGKLIGQYEQAGGDFGQLYYYMLERGRMDVANAMAQYKLSKLLEDVPGIKTQEDANKVYQILKETGLLSQLSSRITIGGLIGIGTVLGFLAKKGFNKFFPGPDGRFKNLINPKNARVLEYIGDEIIQRVALREAPNPPQELNRLNHLIQDLSNDKLKMNSEVFQREFSKVLRDMMDKGYISVSDLSDIFRRASEFPDLDKRTKKSFKDLAKKIDRVGNHGFKDALDKIVKQGGRTLAGKLASRASIGLFTAAIGGPIGLAIDVFLLADTVLELTTGKGIIDIAEDVFNNSDDDNVDKLHKKRAVQDDSSRHKQVDDNLQEIYKKRDILDENSTNSDSKNP